MPEPSSYGVPQPVSTYYLSNGITAISPSETRYLGLHVGQYVSGEGAPRNGVGNRFLGKGLRYTEQIWKTDGDKGLEEQV